MPVLGTVTPELRIITALIITKFIGAVRLSGRYKSPKASTHH
jgi:hypothetical protein